MIKTPLFPNYGTTHALLRMLHDQPVAQFRSMWYAVSHLRGTQQQATHWANPDVWIQERLTGNDQMMARKIWLESNKTINPRWIAGDLHLMKSYKLIEEVNGIYKLTGRGVLFSGSVDNTITHEIDEAEGVLYLLQLATTLQKGKRCDFLAAWTGYIKANSQVQEPGVITDYLRRRLLNLTDRGYLIRAGNVYTITDCGKKYLETTADKGTKNETLKGLTSITKQIEALNKAHRTLLKQYLEQVSPVQFEHLVKALLREMGYEDIVVTSPANDKGVDVTAVSQHGITKVKEVIQVKRFTRTNVQRPVLDGLRGSLHRFDAFQGTIITLSDFARGAKDAAYEKGAAPITLIDGEKLIDMLIEKQLGIKQHQLSYLMVDEMFFQNRSGNCMGA